MPLSRDDIRDWALAHGFRGTSDVLACRHGDRMIRLTFQQRTFRFDELMGGEPSRLIGRAYYSAPLLSLNPDYDVIRGVGLFTRWYGGFVMGRTVRRLPSPHAEIPKLQSEPPRLGWSRSPEIAREAPGFSPGEAERRARHGPIGAWIGANFRLFRKAAHD